MSGLAAIFNQLVTSPLIAMESFQALNNLTGHVVTGNWQSAIFYWGQLWGMTYVKSTSMSMPISVQEVFDLQGQGHDPPHMAM